MPRPAVLLAAVATVATGVAVLVAPAAQAAAPVRPARPQGEHVAALGHTSITVALPRIAHATHYRLYVSTRRGDLAVARLSHARRSKAYSKPRMTVARLPYTTAHYYYRVRAVNGTRSRYGTRIGVTTLRPATPSRLRVTSSRAGTSLSWRAGSGYQRTQVVRSSDEAMRAGVHVFTLRGTTSRFTPGGAVFGRRYWYRVRTLVRLTASAWSAPTTAVTRSRAQPLRLLSYNVLTSRADGTVITGERIAPWAKRRAGVLAMIRRAAPDVMCLQEGGGWAGSVHGYGGTRQVDDLLRSLPGWALVRSETPPTEHHYLRYGNYVLYRTSLYRAVGAGGHWDLGDTRTAAYQLLQRRSSGAKLLVVSAHLAYTAGRHGDDLRAAETRRLLALAGGLARRHGAPVVYAGDFNSARNRNHVYDAVGTTMARAGIGNAQDVAQSLSNAAYNSANQYRRTPPRAGQSIDYVFAPPGISVASRSLLLDLVAGRFRGTIPSDHNPLLVTATFPY